MKKEVIIVMIFLLAFLVVVSAAQNANLTVKGIAKNYVLNSTNKTLAEIKQEIKDDIKELREARKELKGDIKAYLRERKEIKAEIKGKNITLEKGDGDEIRLRIKNFTARTFLNITEEVDENNNTILKVKHQDKVREIKIMPDTASERALERLKLKVCSEENNCTIQLKDVPVGKALKKIAYEIKVEKHYKLLGLFKKKLIERAEIDAETGEVVLKKPWWAFLAKQE